jgi:hypothetical protein
MVYLFNSHMPAVYATGRRVKKPYDLQAGAGDTPTCSVVMLQVLRLRHCWEPTAYLLATFKEQPETVAAFAVPLGCRKYNHAPPLSQDRGVRVGN